VPEANFLGIDKLSGYRRVFDVESYNLKDSETGIFACALNLSEDENIDVFGALFDIPEDSFQELAKRETRYGDVKIKLESGKSATTFIAENHDRYNYVLNNKTQDEYLKICLDAAKSYGDEFLDNFLDSTYIGETTLRDWIKK